MSPGDPYAPGDPLAPGDGPGALDQDPWETGVLMRQPGPDETPTLEY